MSQIYAQSHISELRRQLSLEDLSDLDRMLAMERKSSGLIAGLAAIGFVGVAGVHRFVMGDVGKGVLMLLTAGGCGIWTIVDLARSSTMAAQYNTELELQAINRMVERKRAVSASQSSTLPPSTGTDPTSF